MNTVQVQSQSKMVAVVEDGLAKGRHVFSAQECQLLLRDEATVKRFFDALDYPDNIFIEVCDLVLEPEVMTELEAYASTVDEL